MALKDTFMESIVDTLSKEVASYSGIGDLYSISLYEVVTLVEGGEKRYRMLLSAERVHAKGVPIQVKFPMGGAFPVFNKDQLKMLVDHFDLDKRNDGFETTLGVIVTLKRGVVEMTTDLLTKDVVVEGAMQAWETGECGGMGDFEEYAWTLLSFDE